MPAWLRRGERQENPDDVPTGQIPARVIAEADRDRNATLSAGTEPLPTASESDVEPLASHAPAGFSDLEQALAHRQSLIQLCFYALDRARSGGVVQRLEHGLAEIGVRAVRPDGDRFDPALHEAGSATPTDDATLDGVVAETEVVGFTDHGRVLRAPIVTVYTKRAP